MLTAEYQTIYNELCQGFMTPDVGRFTNDHELGDDYQGKGWYCRLSASGYLDCTDWSGPFCTEQEAIEYLCDTYGN